MSRHADPHRDPRDRHGGGRAPRRGAQEGHVVLSATNGSDAAKEFDNARTWGSSRDGPRRVGGDDVADVRDERSNRRRVLLAPDVDRRIRERVAERRRQGRREHQIAQVVE